MAVRLRANGRVTAVNNIGEKVVREKHQVAGTYWHAAVIGFGGGGITRVTLTTDEPDFSWQIYVEYDVVDCPTSPPGPTPTPPASTPVVDDKVVPACPIEAPTPTDTTFVTKATDSSYFFPLAAKERNTFRSKGPVIISLDVERVVGESGGEGTLLYPQELVNNGVVSATAKLRLPVYDVDYVYDGPVYHPERNRITFNGVDIGPSPTAPKVYLSGKDKQWVMNEFDVPISLVKFGRMNPEGGPPIKGRNQITIWPDEANEFSGDDRWGFGVSWAALQFSALAPVVMIHGNSSCGDFFAGNVLTPCAGSGGYRLPEDRWFIKPFIEKRIPFDHSISMTPNDSIDNHANYLAGKIPEVARKFGAKHVHIVAHSKGGLDVRKFLTLIKPNTIGVYSLTTLSTPHAGSPGADYQLDAQEAYKRNFASTPKLNLFPGSYEGVVFARGNTLVLSDSPLRTALALAVPPNAGTPYLRVDAMRGFNEENKASLPRSFTVDGVTNKMIYHAVSADANLDNSQIAGEPTITENETEGVPPINHNIPGLYPLIGYTKVKLYQQLYLMIGTVQSTELRAIAGFPGLALGAYGVKENVDYITVDGKKYAKFVTNDFAVHRRSAAIFPMEKLGFDHWWGVKANHATISSSETAAGVINGIIAAQQQ